MIVQGDHDAMAFIFAHYVDHQGSILGGWLFLCLCVSAD